MHKGRLTFAAILGLAAIAMLLTPNSGFWPAALTGLSIGYFNLEILFRRIGKSTESSTDLSAALRLMRTGTGLRFSTASLGALAVIKFKLSLA